MRVFRGIILGVIVLAGLLVGTLWLLRTSLANVVIERQLQALGFERSEARVSTLTLGEIVISKVSAGGANAPPEIEIFDLSARFRWREVLRSLRVESFGVREGRILIRVDSTGSVAIGPLSLRPTAQPGQGSRPAASAVAVEALTIVLITPEGEIETRLHGSFSDQAGGVLEASFASPRAGLDVAGAGGMAAFALVGSDIEGEALVSLRSDGAGAIDASIRSDVTIPVGDLTDLDIAATGSISDWRKLLSGDRDHAGRMRVSLRGGRLESSRSPLLSGLTVGGERAVGSISATGEILAVYDNGAIRVDTIDGPIVVVSETGDRLSIGASDGAVLFEAEDAGRRLDLSFRIEGAAEAAVKIVASQAPAAPWLFSTLAELNGPRLLGAEIPAASIHANGDFDGKTIRAIAEGEIAVTRSAIGRMRITNAALRFLLPLEVDLDQSKAIFGGNVNTCLRLARAEFAMSEPSLKGNIVDGTICSDAAPLAVVDWTQNGVTRIEGILSAKSGRLSIEETTMAGVPPAIDFVANYRKDLETTEVAGRFAGGSVSINDAFTLSSAEGSLAGSIKGPDLEATLTLATARFAQPGPSPLIAPMRIQGEGRLSGDRFAFTGEVWTPSGIPVGALSGSHDVRTATGFAVLDAARLEFRPGALQLASLSALLAGMTSEANGAAQARFRMDWDRAKVTTGGEVTLDGLSFRGPGIAVSRTGGLVGELQFSSLLPARTDGEQLLRVALIDLDALKLENGEVRFRIDGDDRLKVSRAEFPWFGGIIGAYDAEMPLDGSRVTTELRASEVDLGKLLTYLNLDGLSGEGVLKGTLPIAIENGRARFVNGELVAVGPGVVRYTGNAGAAASAASSESRLAFDVLRELRFSRLTASLDGPLDGNVDVQIFFEGTSAIAFGEGRLRSGPVVSPVIYRIKVKAPLLSLVEQAKLSADVRLQIERLQQDEERRSQGSAKER